MTSAIYTENHHHYHPNALLHSTNTSNILFHLTLLHFSPLSPDVRNSLHSTIPLTNTFTHRFDSFFPFHTVSSVSPFPSDARRVVTVLAGRECDKITVICAPVLLSVVYPSVRRSQQPGVWCLLFWDTLGTALSNPDLQQKLSAKHRRRDAWIVYCGPGTDEHDDDPRRITIGDGFSVWKQ